MASVDDTVAAIASVQHGLFTPAQAQQAGATRGFVRHRLATGRWIQVTPRVLMMPGSPDSWHRRLLAAILDAGPGAAADRHAGARLWGIPGFDGPFIDVVRPRRRHHTPPPRFVREAFLPAHHVHVRDLIPVTTPARCLFGLAASIGEPRLERAVDNALAMRLLTPADLHDMLRTMARRGRNGSAAFRHIVEIRCDDFVPPASELEAVLIELVREAGVPEPARQLWVYDEDGPIGRFDLGWEEERLVLEGDSRRHHMSVLDFEQDRRRDARLVAAGWRPLRVSWRQATLERADTILRLRRALTVSPAVTSPAHPSGEPRGPDARGNPRPFSPPVWLS